MKQKGFTLIELMVAIALTVTVMLAAMTLYQKSVQVSTFVSQQSEMQTEVRAAANQLVRDLNQAGTGIPVGGIPIPSAASGGTNPKFACDPIKCYITAGNTFTQGVLYKVTPANGVGPNVVQASDAIIITYKDPTLTWTIAGSNPVLPATTQVAALNGSTLTMPANTTPPLDDPALGLNVGDVLLLQNASGAAVGVVTNYVANTRVISFTNLDPLNMNQSAATAGNIKSLEFNPVPGAAPYYPAITVSRIMMITYFIQTINTPDGPDTQLMRQIGARTPTPVADHIENLQFTYDVFDTNTSTLTAALPDAAIGTPAVAVPNQIRKINITMSVRSPRPNAQGVFDHFSLTTSIGPRNLSFHDRYN
jgi:prepilin-type N-terminal cleavage/methylation domain-containing protein